MRVAVGSLAQPDSYDKKAALYQHPQSFYFAGYPLDPPNAPIVSQNYTKLANGCPDAQASSPAKAPNWSKIKP